MGAVRSGVLAAGVLALMAPSAESTPRQASARSASAEVRDLRIRAAEAERQAAAAAADLEALAAARTAMDTAESEARTRQAQAEANATEARRRVERTETALERMTMAAWFARESAAPNRRLRAAPLAAAETARMARRAAAEARSARAVADAAQTEASTLAAARIAAVADAAAAADRLETARLAQSRYAARVAAVQTRAVDPRFQTTAAARPATRTARALLGARGGRTIASFRPEAPGVTLVGARGQAVLAPTAARVQFAEPFRDYGDVIILESVSGYAIVLIGLEAADLRVGQRVRAGETLGRLVDLAAVAPELYVEVRRASRAVDPEQVAQGWRGGERQAASRSGS